jgi:hypothetical protein
MDLGVREISQAAGMVEMLDSDNPAAQFLYQPGLVLDQYQPANNSLWNRFVETGPAGIRSSNDGKSSRVRHLIRLA